MSRTARTTRTRSTRSGITRPVVVTALSIAAALVAPLAAAPAQAHEAKAGHTAAQQAYVASLVNRHDAATGATPLEEYARVLVYWHNNPTWGI
ncbi:MAG TPA: hypothetical protein VFR56_04680 [Actinomycetes bacterium]|nr:hypothetical protein [Actinomycetes bacterium]